MKVREFGVIFKRFLDHAQLPPDSNAPILRQIKGLVEIHNRVKFDEFMVAKL